MATDNNTPKGRPGPVQTVSNNTSRQTEGDLARALIKDALQRLGKARLSLDLTRDLLDLGATELATAADKLAAAAALHAGGAT
jgi:hypothetical protein